jgi:tRNA 2-selenouridine synthase
MTAQTLPIKDFLAQSQNHLLIDVRAPIEFAQGHLPFAVNIPLFEDTERAEIGTLYKHQGKEPAVTRGLEIVSPKMVDFIHQVKDLSSSKKVFVYCFRGGMRSSSFAWLMQTAGFEAKILTGGYKAFRNELLTFFKEEKKIILLGGKTGSGKTEVLKKIKEKGFQTVDLEFHANHKGSAFGSINELPQNPQQWFDSDLFQAFNTLNLEKALFLEDESQTIGINKLPHGLWLQMLKAPIIKLEIPFELRVQKLVEDYTTTRIEDLKASVMKISSKLGPLHTKLCLGHLDDGNLSEVARLSLLHYDKTYEYGYKNKSQKILLAQSETINAEINANKVLDAVHDLDLWK